MKCASTPYDTGQCPQGLEVWATAVPDREKLSPLAACWYSELGGLNKFVHIWVYKDRNERTRVRVAAPGRCAANAPGKQAPGAGGLLAGAVVVRRDDRTA